MRARYIVVTAKHHDGFARFGSQVSDYNIVRRTPFARGPLKELAEACCRQGIRLSSIWGRIEPGRRADLVWLDTELRMRGVWQGSEARS